MALRDWRAIWLFIDGPCTKRARPLKDYLTADGVECEDKKIRVTVKTGCLRGVQKVVRLLVSSLLLFKPAGSKILIQENISTMYYVGSATIPSQNFMSFCQAPIGSLSKNIIER